jgi:hypothetical protein
MGGIEVLMAKKFLQVFGWMSDAFHTNVNTGVRKPIKRVFHANLK